MYMPRFLMHSISPEVNGKFEAMCTVHRYVEETPYLNSSMHVNEPYLRHQTDLSYILIIP